MGYVISSEYRVVFEWVEEKYSERLISPARRAKATPILL